MIAHAGMGSIITALELGKQIIIMPRRASLGEHRNDHQVATAKQFAAQGRIEVALDETELADKLDQLHVLNRGECLGAEASPQLILTIRNLSKPDMFVPQPSSASALATWSARQSGLYPFLGVRSFLAKSWPAVDRRSSQIDRRVDPTSHAVCNDWCSYVERHDWHRGRWIRLLGPNLVRNFAASAASSPSATLIR